VRNARRHALMPGDKLTGWNAGGPQWHRRIEKRVYPFFVLFFQGMAGYVVEAIESRDLNSVEYRGWWDLGRYSYAGASPREPALFNTDGSAGCAEEAPKARAVAGVSDGPFITSRRRRRERYGFGGAPLRTRRGSRLPMLASWRHGVLLRRRRPGRLHWRGLAGCCHLDRSETIADHRPGLSTGRAAGQGFRHDPTVADIYARWDGHEYVRLLIGLRAYAMALVAVGVAY